MAYAATFALSVLLALALPSTQGELVIVKEGTKQYHRPGCDVVRDGKGVIAMTRAQAEGRKLTQHGACDPAKKPADPKKPGAETRVYVDEGRYYHREGCKRLGKDPKPMTLDDAGRKFWPCPACKPPIRPRPKQ